MSGCGVCECCFYHAADRRMREKVEEAEYERDMNDQYEEYIREQVRAARLACDELGGCAHFPCQACGRRHASDDR
jgi:hypothetical protein